jgi:DNA-binding SARP family transcriptional activator
MTAETITGVALDAFQQKTAGKQVVLLYYWSPYRSVFLSHFLAQPESGLLYYRLRDPQTTLEQWLGDLAAELGRVTGGFGAALRQALADSPAKADALGKALAADLNAYGSRPAVLYLDEIDRTPYDAAFERFARALVDALADDSQIVCCGRTLTYTPWYAYVAAGRAVVLGAECRKDDVIFTVTPKPRPQLEVYALGQGYALVNGRPVTNWDGALPHNLFFYFIDHPLVTRDTVFETFWPELSVKEATNVFHVTKRKISERISAKVGSGHNYELTQYSSGFYVPGDTITRHYDVGDFTGALERALTAADDAQEEALLARAIALYRAPFAETITMPWAVQRRDQLRQSYAQALISMGRLHRRRGDAQRALGFFARALKETPEREDVHRDVMNLYLKLEMPNEALRQYRALEHLLDEQLRISPARESRELFEAINSR